MMPAARVMDARRMTSFLQVLFDKTVLRIVSLVAILVVSVLISGIVLPSNAYAAEDEGTLTKMYLTEDLSGDPVNKITLQKSDEAQYFYIGCSFIKDINDQSKLKKTDVRCFFANENIASYMYYTEYVGVVELDGVNYVVRKVPIWGNSVGSTTFTCQGYYSTTTNVKTEISTFDIEVVEGSSVQTIDAPSAATNLTYSGLEQEGVAAPAEGAGYTLSGDTKATDAGDHTATATLSDKTNTTWSDGTTDDKTISWSIAKKTVTVTAQDQTITVGDSIDTTTISVSGWIGDSAPVGYIAPTVKIYQGESPFEGTLTAGSYSLVPSGGEPTNNYEFSFAEGSLTVNPVAGSIVAPTAATNLTYSGSEQVGVAAPAEGAGYTLSGDTKATDAGNYTATATLSDKTNTTWSDGTTGDKTLTWSIAKATLNAAYAGESIAFGKTPTLTVNVTGFVNGETAATAAGYKAPTVTAPLTIVVAESPYSLTPAGGVADNYSFAYTAGNLVVTAISVTAPTAATNLTYTGLEQVGVAAPAEGAGYTLSGDTKATDAGNYTATATLSDKTNTTWSDGTTGDKTISWSIAKATLNAAYAGETIEWDAEPALEVEVTGFVHGESETTAKDYSAPTIAKPTNLASGQSYRLSPAGGSAKNYVFTYTSGLLVLGAQPDPSEATLTMSATDQSSLKSLVLQGQPTSVSVSYEGREDVTAEDVSCTCKTGGIVSASYNPSTEILTVEPLAAGSDTITVAIAGNSYFTNATIDIPVTVNKVAASFTPDSEVSLVVGGDAWVATYSAPFNAPVLSREDVVTATLSNDGKTVTVTPIAAGEVTLTLSANETSEYQALAATSITFKVTGVDDSSGKETIYFDPVTLEAGATGTASVKFEDAEGNAIADSAITVTSSDESVAKATYSNGTLTINGLAAGTAEISFTSEELADNYAVKVTVTAAKSNVTVIDNSGTGITVDTSALSLSDEYANASEVTLTVTPLTSGTAHESLKAEIKGSLLGVFEVTLAADGTEIHKDFGSIVLTFPVGSAYNGKQVIIRHLHQDGTITSETVTVANGVATISVTDLSTFSVESTSGDNQSTNTGTTNSTSTTSGTGLSKTGDDALAAVWGALGVLGIVAVGIGTNTVLRRRRASANEAEAGEPLDKTC